MSGLGLRIKSLGSKFLKGGYVGVYIYINMIDLSGLLKGMPGG